ncbi:thioester-containing protein 1 allele S3-like [Anopheles moucheti]|uniref:thioester-containing protein 1 allele S3-like n=1 Tax=Anopheles moucheti TaxID=186751 RepID=UPI0022F078B1|nr:thioester-containing protein 1 allele S3-like [Anopheles moucheti]
MWQFIRSRILTVIIFIGAAHGILVVGPKFIRANQDYTVVISNFNSNVSKVDLMLQVEGRSNDDMSVLNLTETVDVRRNMNRMITFNMPADLSAGNYTFTIDGQSGFSFHEQADLVFLGKSVSGLIQTNKPVFTPGDTVKFRVIVLDSDLKPPELVKTVHVTIRDQDGNEIEKWPSAKLHAGVFENDLQLAPTAMSGMWNITVQMDGEELVSKPFEVKEYVLPSFDLEVLASVIPLEVHQGLNLTIAANNYRRKPVKGLVKVELYLEKDVLDQEIEFEMYGIKQMKLPFVDRFEVHEDQKDVLLKTTLIEQHTNRTVVKESRITVYKHAYRVQLIKETPPFLPGLPFKCALQFRYHDGTPAQGISGKVEILDIGYEATATSDKDGLIKLELNSSDSVDSMYINFYKDDGFYFYERVVKDHAVPNAYIKLELRSPILVNRLLQFMITCSNPVTFFTYFIVSKGNIVDSSTIRPTNQNKYNKYVFRLIASEKMSPKAKIIIMTAVNGVVVYDYVDINFEDLRNNFVVRIDKQKAEPGQQIELHMSGRPGAYVGLAAYNKRSTFRNEDHESFWDDIMRMYGGHDSNAENVKEDKFRSMGLFVRTLNDMKFNEAHGMAARYELQINNPIPKSEPKLRSFPESWLWQNVSIGRSGLQRMNATVSDTITSWYLTGFSIDPVYGLGIIREPIQFTTFKPFYIVESLPSSIKRYEAVELQFTLFNLLEEEYIADVTLYKVDDQMRFVDQPLEESTYIKSVSVPSKVGVPISFLVKALKLEAIVVRVEATIELTKSRRLTDALEKVIRVTPESLLHAREDSRFFSFDTYQNKTFRMNLDVHKKADNGSQKIEIRLRPNLLTDVVGNLDEVRKPSSDFLEEIMVWFVPNIMMLDYLHAIGSKEKDLIDKATDLSYQGYRNLTNFYKPDGSFVAWNREGHLFLTTFAAKAMQTASKYITEFDASMLETTCGWLAWKQHGSGRFDEFSNVVHMTLRGGLYDSIPLTSYVVTALLENEYARMKHAVVIEKAMAYLSGKVETIEDPYQLAIVTYAFMLNEHKLKDVAIGRLINMSIITKNGKEKYWETDNGVETTAYALLSYVLAEKYVEAIPLMRWLVNQNFVKESYQHVQSTYVALKALTKLAEKLSPSRNDYAIEVKYNQPSSTTTTLPKQTLINSQQLDVIKYENIPQDTRWVEVTVAGVGSGMLEVIYQYSLNLVYFANRFVLDVERQNTTSDYELQLNVCASFIPTWSDQSSTVAVIEVTFPNGYVVDQYPVSREQSEIMEVAVRFGGTSVYVYYDGMDEERKCFTVNAYRRGNVTMKHPGYVIAYDLYNQHFNAIKSYDVDKQDA